jgi:hypothetical protein
MNSPENLAFRRAEIPSKPLEVKTNQLAYPKTRSVRYLRYVPLNASNPLSSDTRMNRQLHTPRNPPNISPKRRDRLASGWLFYESRQISCQFGGIAGAVHK